MVAQLVIRVQVDRLPNVKDEHGKDHLQIGLRLSAAIRPEMGKAVPSHTNIVHDLLPWQWNASDGSAKFNPHDVDSWSVYHQEKPRASIDLVAGGLAASVTTARQDDFIARLNADAATLAENPSTLALPTTTRGGDPDTIIGRTVYGIVESLTALPHPIPAGTMTFTALSIDREKIANLAETSRFFAVPVLAPATGGKTDYSAGFTWAVLDRERIENEIDVDVSEGGNWKKLHFEVQGSKPETFLARDPVNDPERVMDLMELSIATAMDGQEAETGEDWAAHLPRRLAEAIDPAIRVSAALETVLADENWPHSDAAVADILPVEGQPAPARLLPAALDKVAALVMAPRARSTPDVLHEAIVTLAELANAPEDGATAREAREEACDLLMNHLSAEPKAPETVPLASLGARFISTARLARALGLPPEDVAAARRPEEDAADALDEEKGFLAFALRHWFAPADPGTNTVLAGQQFTPIPSDDPSDIAVLGQTLLDTVGLRFEVQLPGADDAKAILRLRHPLEDIDFVEVIFSRTDGAYEFLIDGSAVAGTYGPELELKIDRAAPREPLRVAAVNANAQGFGKDDAHPFSERFLVTFETEGEASIAPRRPAGRLANVVKDKFTAAGLRAQMSIAHAAPYIPALLKLRGNWDDIATPEPIPPRDPPVTGEPVPFRERLAASATKLLKAVLDDCLGLAGGGTGTAWLTETLEAIRDEAVAAVRPLVLAAVPARDGAAARPRVSETALPLTFRIDQLVGQEGDDDLWQRLSGAGLFVSRAYSADGLPPADAAFAHWYTLNAAAIAARPEGTATPSFTYTNTSPWFPGEAAGARQSLVRYENSWLATRLIGDPELDPPEGEVPPVVPRRPEVIRSPGETEMGKKARLPALSYGYYFKLLPFLFGQGGVLPTWYRANEMDPVTAKAGRDVPNKLPLAETGGTPTVPLPYLRSRPIGTPRLLPANPGTHAQDAPILPPIAEGVEPLAAELPIRPPPVTLQAGVDADFFRDREGKVGTLSLGTPRAEVEKDADTGETLVPLSRTGLSVLLRGIDEPAGKKVKVRFLGTTGPEDAARPFLEVEVTLKETNLRLDLLRTVSGTPGSETYDLSLGVFTAPDPVDTGGRVYAEDVPGFAAADASDFNSGAVIEPGEPWDRVFISLEADGVTLEPPVVTTVEQAITAAPDPAKTPASTGKPLLPPEVVHQARQTVLVHDFPAADKEASFRLRRPTVDFATFERWVNTAFLEDKSAADMRSLLNNAFSLSEYEPQVRPSGVEKVEKDYDDPACGGMIVELVEIFPRYRPVDAIPLPAPTGLALFGGFPQPLYSGGKVESIKALVLETYTVQCNIRSAGEIRKAGETDLVPGATEASMDVTDGKLRVTTVPGRVYELRVAAIVPPAQPDITGMESADRLSPAVRAGLRQVQVQGTPHLVSQPLVITIEAATRRMPDAFEARWGNEPGPIRLVRPPEAREDLALIGLPAALQGAGGYHDGGTLHDNTRFVSSAALYSQRWDWRGRPQPVLPDFEGFQGPDPALAAFASKAFSDRATRDIGPIDSRAVDRNQVYGGRERQGQARSSDHVPPALFEKPLDWQTGMHLRRFGMRLTSRYLALEPAAREDLVRYTHLDPGGQVAPEWTLLAVPARPTGRKIRRPAVALVLPLTEGLAERDPTPPLLVLFNERLYADHNVADGIEAIIETARHPFTPLDAVDRALENATGEDKAELEFYREGLVGSVGAQKFWPEIGPDPVRTGRAHDGSQVSVRQDGPIGYGFDIGTEAGRFGSAGLLVQAAGSGVQPWSMVKLRFRRFEPPAALFEPDPNQAASGKARRGEANLAPGEKKTLPIRTDPGFDDNPFERFEHEGVAIDVTLPTPTDDPETGAFAVSLAEAMTGTETVVLHYVVTPTHLSAWAETPLGPTARATVQVGRETLLRAVVSHVDPPGDAENWRPSGNLVVKLRTKGGNVPDAGEWLTLNDVPLLRATEQKTSYPVHLGLENRAGAATLLARPLRLSGFTGGTWCQFTEAMSVFRARLENDEEQTAWTTLATGSLRARVTSMAAGTYLQLRASEKDLQPPQIDPLAPAMFRLALKSPTDVAAAAQVEHALFAVVTRYFHDAFDRVVERPVCVSRILAPEDRPTRHGDALLIPVSKDALENDDDLVAWKDTEATGGLDNVAGRLRLLKVLLPRGFSDGGYGPDGRRFALADLFVPDDANANPLNPRDGQGIVLGVSAPIEFKSG